MADWLREIAASATAAAHCQPVEGRQGAIDRVMLRLTGAASCSLMRFMPTDICRLPSARVIVIAPAPQMLRSWPRNTHGREPPAGEGRGRIRSSFPRTRSMYKLVLHEVTGLGLFEATGSFTHADTWELVGDATRVATFTFISGGVAERSIGKSVTGVPTYTPKERAAGTLICGTTLRIDTAMHDVKPQVRRLLEHRGVALDEVAVMQFLPLFATRCDRHETGEKKIPNVIAIPYKHDALVNADRFTQNCLIMKNNGGVELAPFEGEQLIGITLAFNDGVIDRRINLSAWDLPRTRRQHHRRSGYHRLKAKQRLGKTGRLGPR